jgi:hypothetical protein
MRTLLRPNAVIESWFDVMSPEQRTVARALQAAVVAAAPKLNGAVRWGNLVYQHDGINALAIVPHKSHVNLQVFKGASLTARYPELEGSSKGVRHWKVRFGQPIDAEFVRELVLDALEALAAEEDPR